MNEKIKVSVVIPSYGGGQYLQRCVDSVLNQTYTNIEVIVVDDNGVGTEHQISTACQMEKYANDKRVKYVCHEVNKNGSAARNTGVNNSTGEYIALLDDDDEFLPEKIAKQVEDLSALDENYALVYCGMEIIVNGESVGVSKKGMSGSVFYEVMMHKAVIGSSRLMVRRCVWDKLSGFDESFWRHQDWEFTARVAYMHKVLNENFIGVRRHYLSRNSPKDPDVTLKYRKHYLEKMMPYMDSLTKGKQKDIIVSNMLDAAFQYLKYHRYLDFIKVYWSIKPGIRGLKGIYSRIKYIAGNK